MPRLFLRLSVWSFFNSTKPWFSNFFTSAVVVDLSRLIFFESSLNESSFVHERQKRMFA